MLSAIADAAFTGGSGDGIVINTLDVDDVYNIASKKRGNEAL